MNLNQKIKELKRALIPVAGEREAYWMTRDIIEDVMGYNEVDMLLKGDEELSDFVARKIDEVAKRVLDGAPLQHVLGWARFAGNRFKVTQDTLIPRPETQELVDLIISRYGDAKDLNIIDVGTGSGCIAISLARGLKFAQVKGIDISDSALMIATENAKNLKAKVVFEHRNALSLQQVKDESYDIIVSNPPYIAESERKDMERVVLDYEPSMALFVSDEDPLVFYRAIASWGRDVLTSDGAIYFEINPRYAIGMMKMMRSMGYEEVEIVKDMQARNRILCAKNPQN